MQEAYGPVLTRVGVTYGEVLDVFPVWELYRHKRELTGAEVRGLLETSLKIQFANMNADIAG